MKKKHGKRKISFDRIVLMSLTILFLVLFIRVGYLSLASVINGVNIEEFVSGRNTRVENIEATRGSIYDVTGKVLSQNVNAYTVIAYLDPKRSEGAKKNLHVADKEKTAKALAPIINMSEEDILTLLNRENVYQVELGPGGRGITELTKEAILELELDGIDFITSYKRYYPNNDFLSYVIGYAVDREKGITGEMGIEGYFDIELRGEDGFREYQKDLYGFKIPNTKEIVQNPIDGKDIYLTINSDIQMFVESAIKEQGLIYNPEFLNINVMDAKTGKILASSSYPSFDPNLLNMTNYLNPLTSFSYEPGSTMKIFSYMAAMEKGTYNGSSTFMSGSKEYDNGVDEEGNKETIKISDWNKKGWGEITYDKGFALSSNIGVANLLETAINKYDLKAYYDKLGFGSKTGIFLPRESTGYVNFKYEVEVVNAGFGQGITTTPIQNLQALTALANDGYMITPHIVEKIVDPKTGKVEYEAEVTKIDKVATTTTVEKMRYLMYKTVHDKKDDTVGYMYKVDGLDVIGKTGTAQIFDNTTGQYMVGSNDVIYSFAGMFPYEDPEIIIYAAMKRPDFGAGSGLYSSVTTIMEDIGKYYNINDINDKYEGNSLEIKVDTLINKNVTSTLDYYTSRGIDVDIIGEEDIILHQYPSSNSILLNKDKLILFTTGDIKVPNLVGYSYKEAKYICNYLNYNCKIEGTGYVTSQSLLEGSIYENELVLNLEPKFKEEEFNNNKNNEDKPNSNK